MDIKHPRPRYSNTFESKNVVSQRHNLSNSFVFAVPSSSALPSYGGGISLAKKDAEKQNTVETDYKKAAEEYKDSAIAQRIYKYLRRLTIFLLVVTLLLATIGIVINILYANKALPFAKIGSVSVGGLNRSEISSLLSDRTKQLNVTLIEGGLTRKVPLSEFNPSYDFSKAIDQSIAKRVNPYSFIISNNTSIEASVNERQVDGYLRQNVTASQARSQDATLEKTRDGVVIKPEIVGFSASTKNVVNSINQAIVNLDNPVVRLNSVTVPPDVYSNDLKSELDEINKLLGANLTINYAGTRTTISNKQKLEWLTISKNPGSFGYSFDFSKDGIRSYVISIADRFQRPVKIDQPNNSDNPAGYSVPTVVINNIESVVDQIYSGLRNGQNTVAVFSLDKSIAQRIPKQEKKEDKPVVSSVTDSQTSQPQAPVQTPPAVNLTSTSNTSSQNTSLSAEENNQSQQN